MNKTISIGSADATRPSVLDGLEASPRITIGIGAWFSAFWPLAAVLLAGALMFRGPIVESIESTPHPELVYAIFAVAAIAAVLFGALLNAFVRERRWIDEQNHLPRARRDARVGERPTDVALTPVYRLLVQTRGRPVLERLRALEHEVESAENQMMARLALPNLLSGSLVGLGLVGTFVGLLATLHDLSGVFSALGAGGGGGGDASAMFSDMIGRLKGPMQGMGTAFVASLYGLLGSLVIGLVGASVKRTGERLFGEVRLHSTEEIYHGAAAVPVEINAAVAASNVSGAAGQALFDVLREEHRQFRVSMEDWSSRFDERIKAMPGTSIELIDQLKEEGRRNAELLERRTTSEEWLMNAMVQSNTALGARMDALREDLHTAGNRGAMLFGRAAIILATLGSLIGLGAIVVGVFFLMNSASGTLAQPVAMSVPAPIVAPSAGTPSAVAPSVDVSASVASTSASASRTASAIMPPASSPAAIAAAMPSSESKGEELVIQQGGSLWKIAAHNGLTVDKLLAANPQITNPKRIRAGTVIRLP